MKKREATIGGVLHLGLYKHRIKDNQEERIMRDLWIELQKNHHALAYLLSPDDLGNWSCVSQRDATVAATVIQWLGSPLGRLWLLKEVVPKIGGDGI